MIHVGLPEHIPADLLQNFPKADIEIVRLPQELDRTMNIEFWIPPASSLATAQQFPHLRGVRVMQCLMAGVDWILPWLPKEIQLCDGRGLHDIPVAEWVLGAILAGLKRFPKYRDWQHEQFWGGQVRLIREQELPQEKRDSPHPAFGYRVLGEELAAKTVLIVGHGSIGERVERILQAFDVAVMRVARTARAGIAAMAELPSLLSSADVVVLLVPLTEETRGLFDAAMIGKMKPGALLVNAARGPVVVTDALMDALHAGRIRAVLDVTDPEPLPKGHPLWAAPNCFITPHIAGSVAEFSARAYAFAGEQVRRYIAGEPLRNQVNAAGY
jgi:phosphoglycerate dehydrogenase-like enzyme